MALKKKGKYWYGDTPDDIKAELVRYSTSNVYRATKFAQPTCACGNSVFRLESDEEEGAGRRTCCSCQEVHLIGDSAEYEADAEFEGHQCVCDGDQFELMVGVALYEGSNEVRWCYIGCRCSKCQLVGVFADWKCEAGDADAFLAEA
jgi:hypothetical protein